MNRLATLTITVSLTAQLFLVSIACATNGGDIPLTLNKAIEIAVTNNTIIRQAVENQKAAIEEQKSARADFLPKALAGYSYARLKDNPYMKTGGAQVDIGDKDRYHRNLTLSQPLFTGLALSTRYEMAISAFNTLLQIDLNRKTDVEDILGITPFPYDLDTPINEAMEYPMKM